MKIAHIIVAHMDPEHNIKLIRRLSQFSDVYVHIDKLSNIDDFKNGVKDIKNCYFLENRLHSEWGGWNLILAEINLLKFASSNGEYDRYVLLYGNDYPIKSNDYIIDFFEKNKNVEFIRGCNCSISKDYYFTKRCKGYWFMNNKNAFKKGINKITSALKFQPRKGTIKSNNKTYDVYWGSALWSLTGDCVKWIINFYDNNPKFNKWFYHCFVPDELYFTTVVMNSIYAEKTLHKGPEPEVKITHNWRNLHYYDYTFFTKTFTEEDFEFLSNSPDLYSRKIDSKKSKKLVELLDNL